MDSRWLGNLFLFRVSFSKEKKSRGNVVPDRMEKFETSPGSVRPRSLPRSRIKSKTIVLKSLWQIFLAVDFLGGIFL